MKALYVDAAGYVPETARLSMGWYDSSVLNRSQVSCEIDPVNVSGENVG